jgi:hypothetical protein
MVPKDAGCVEVGGSIVAAGGTVVATCGVGEGGIGDSVGAGGVAAKLHAKINRRKIERMPGFLFIIQFDSSFDEF